MLRAPAWACGRVLLILGLVFDRRVSCVLLDRLDAVERGLPAVGRLARRDYLAVRSVEIEVELAGQTLLEDEGAPQAARLRSATDYPRLAETSLVWYLDTNEKHAPSRPSSRVHRAAACLHGQNPVQPPRALRPACVRDIGSAGTSGLGERARHAGDRGPGQPAGGSGSAEGGEAKSRGKAPARPPGSPDEAGLEGWPRQTWSVGSVATSSGALANLSAPENQAFVVSLIEQAAPLEFQQGLDELVEILTKPEVQVRESRCAICNQLQGQAHADEGCEAEARLEEIEDHLSTLNQLVIRQYEHATR